jgi:tetrahydromethanopterin S-methyltransferase subunit G
MSDTKMIQAILDRVVVIDKKVTSTEKQTKKGFQNVTSRLDKIGKSVAYLEDDTPTIDEFNKLVRRVTKLENQIGKN